ncbi:hypothetical protein HYG77_35105 (plasmid) [Rhodococcus sp. ZPP]|uniref:hypothetical protein n=1 Tax=Rhodococcus sp. ZPP TaxID=2749906 RepID=UPI001AD85E2B|nr:hypothetical protein [Rhodococcus sp. ZPP]QTJ70693.1 hypothetical protein HYG77_35105 [Rhodococcus sp. ZPP]
MTGTFADQITQLHAIRRGTSMENQPVYMAVLTANGASLAPEGQEVVYLASNVPAFPHDGSARRKPWYSEAIMRSVSAHLDGLDTEIGGIETSPGDLMTDFTAPNASYFHVDMTPLRLAMNRPAPAGAATGRRSSDTFTPVPALTPAVKSAAGPAASRPRPPSGSTSRVMPAPGTVEPARGASTRY